MSVSAKLHETELSSKSLADALFTATQQKLLGLLFGQPERSFYVTELIELANIGRGAMQRELSRLERSELLLIERQGNQKHYRANPQASIYEELCAIVRKTVGLIEQVRAALVPLEKNVRLALIYGSVAKRTDKASSDVDLLIVSDDLTLENVYCVIDPVEKQIDRKINPTLYTDREFELRRKNGNPFLAKVLQGPTIIFCGEIDGD